MNSQIRNEQKMRSFVYVSVCVCMCMHFCILFLSIAVMLILKLTNGFSANLVKISADQVEIGNLILKFQWTCKGQR